jgi:hypothetical protein
MSDIISLRSDVDRNMSSEAGNFADLMLPNEPGCFDMPPINESLESDKALEDLTS